MKQVGRGALLAGGALLLALAITGGVFACGFTTAATTFAVTSAAEGLASITENSASRPTLTAYGLFQGAIPCGSLFTVTPAAGYPGDLVVTVSIANADELTKCYRILAMKIEVRDSSNNLVNNIGGGGNYALLNLSNCSVDLYLDGSDTYNINIGGGYYVTHRYNAAKWGAGSTSPILYADIGQR